MCSLNVKEMIMSLSNKVFDQLVVQGNERTAAQMAAFFNVPVVSVRARISELRTQLGYAIYANKRTDTKGRTKTFYRAGSPTRAVIAAGYRALAQG
jgi:predicted ArsR family transcriptional regulator